MRQCWQLGDLSESVERTLFYIFAADPRASSTHAVPEVKEGKGDSEFSQRPSTNWSNQPNTAWGRGRGRGRGQPFNRGHDGPVEQDSGTSRSHPVQFGSHSPGKRQDILAKISEAFPTLREKDAAIACAKRLKSLWDSFQGKLIKLKELKIKVDLFFDLLLFNGSQVTLSNIREL